MSEEIQASVDITLKRLSGKITLMGEIMGRRIQYEVEGGGCMTEAEVGELIAGLEKMRRRTRTMYRRIYGTMPKPEKP